MRKFIVFGCALLLLFSFVIGCDREVTETIIIESNGTDDCFTCHGDDGYLLQAKGEWQNSTHASGTNVDYTNRGGGSDCTKCHNHNGFIEFLATGGVQAPYDNVSAIHCFTCHAPHETGDLSLRTDDPVELIDGDTYDYGKGNLCVNCHQARTSPAAIGDNFYISSTHWGPHHGPQGDVLARTLGYEFDGYNYTSSNHAGATDESCVTCHMGDPRQHSGYGVGGHSFNIQDEEGNSIVGVCAGCHATADDDDIIDFTADFDYDHDGEVEGYQTEMHGLMDSLHILLIAAGTIDAEGHPVKDTVALAGVAGATWNFLVVEEDQSMGMHNFKYLQGLIQSSIEYMNTVNGSAIAMRPQSAH